MRLQDRVAVVTGAGSGIGQAIATTFAQAGARVVVNDVKRERAEDTVRLIAKSGGEARAIQCDVTDANAVNAMIRETDDAFGRVDILVNNAGASVGDDILEIDEGVWDFNLALVLKGVFLCSRAVLPQMIERRSGVILNISSVNGETGLGEEAYGAAKAGVINLTKNMAVKYGQFGVRANCIAPGTIRTPIWQARIDRDPHVFERLAKWYPLGRVGEPQDVANAALFLVSDEATWITGEVLNVDGGLMAGTYRMSLELQAKGGEDDE